MFRFHDCVSYLYSNRFSMLAVFELSFLTVRDISERKEQRAKIRDLNFQLESPR